MAAIRELQLVEQLNKNESFMSSVSVGFGLYSYVFMYPFLGICSLHIVYFTVKENPGVQKKF